MTTGKRYEDEERDDGRDDAWHLDKKISVGMGLYILAQTVAFVYVGTGWKSDLEHRVTLVEKILDGMALTEHRLTLLEANYGSINSSLVRIEDKLDGGQPARGHSP